MNPYAPPSTGTPEKEAPGAVTKMSWQDCLTAIGAFLICFVAALLLTAFATCALGFVLMLILSFVA